MRLTQRVVVFRGNCQAHHLAAIFDSSGLCDAYVCEPDYGFLPSFRGKIAKFVSESEAVTLLLKAKGSGRPTYLAQQFTPMAVADLTVYQPIVDAIIGYPFVQFEAMLPPYHINVESKPERIKRVYAADISGMRQSQIDAGTSIDYAGFVEENHPKRPLFHTHGHPGPELTAMLFKDIAEQIGFEDYAVIEKVEAELRSQEGLSFESGHPIPKVVRQALDFHWPESYELYCKMIEAITARDWTWICDNAQELEAQFPQDTQRLVANALAGLDLGLTPELGAIFEELVHREPGYTYFWRLLLEYNIASDRTRIPDTLKRAAEAIRNSPLEKKLVDDLLERSKEYGIHSME